ncbi:MAG: hypothetical protein IPP15_06585 [Saprospiraceae bacterium]|uniref:Uncharacterized protein n=1 Tax=Candidatus Opimibacter skivensis TaxID=2982028 RepID=A0A9D7SWB4_9BACT|nr:hypothetical protein [Candidatus Opimibacter skivensis]
MNTRNGRMWLVQFGNDGHRIIDDLNFKDLVTLDKEVNDRFTLYSTQNIYTFLLLDQFDGKIWQVQWGFDAKERIIVPIE